MDHLSKLFSSELWFSGLSYMYQYLSASHAVQHNVQLQREMKLLPSNLPDLMIPVIAPNKHKGPTAGGLPDVNALGGNIGDAPEASFAKVMQCLLADTHMPSSSRLPVPLSRLQQTWMSSDELMKLL